MRRPSFSRKDGMKRDREITSVPDRLVSTGKSEAVACLFPFLGPPAQNEIHDGDYPRCNPQALLRLPQPSALTLLSVLAAEETPCRPLGTPTLGA